MILYAGANILTLSIIYALQKMKNVAKRVEFLLRIRKRLYSKRDMEFSFLKSFVCSSISSRKFYNSNANKCTNASFNICSYSLKTKRPTSLYCIL
jgi:hypothetical protein